MTENKFVLHDHFSQHHHFDFRLERDGVLVRLGGPERTAGQHPVNAGLRLQSRITSFPMGTLRVRSRKGNMARER